MSGEQPPQPLTRADLEGITAAFTAALTTLTTNFTTLLNENNRRRDREGERTRRNRNNNNHIASESSSEEEEEDEEPRNNRDDQGYRIKADIPYFYGNMDAREETDKGGGLSFEKHRSSVVGQTSTATSKTKTSTY
nr:hypothetical protein [Tanacetum cinerariifolium]